MDNKCNINQHHLLYQINTISPARRRSQDNLSHNPFIRLPLEDGKQMIPPKK